MKHTLTLCTIALAASSASAQLPAERIHKFIPITSEEFGLGLGQSRMSPELHVNDIDSITFDVDAQRFTVYGGQTENKGMKTASYNLELLRGFELTYLVSGYMPSTCLDCKMVALNAYKMMWRPVEGASGYQIRYTATPFDIVDWNDSEIMAGDTIVGPDATEVLIEHLNYSTNYNFAIRTLSPVGEGYHSEWSSRINFYLLEWNNRMSVTTDTRYTLPAVTEVVSTGVGSVTVRLNTEFDESLYSYNDLYQIRSHLELDGDRFVVDKLRFKNNVTGEVTYYPVTAADLEAGEMTVSGLDEGASYSVAAYNSNIKWECDAAYNAVMFRSKLDSSTPITVSSADIGSVLSEYMEDDAHAENQVFYLEGDKTYTISSIVSITKGFTLATLPEDYAAGKRAKVEFATSAALYLGAQIASGPDREYPEDIDPIVLDGIDFSVPGAVNYGAQSIGVGSVTGNYFINCYSNSDSFNIKALELKNNTFQGFLRGFVRLQGSSSHMISKVKVDGNLFYNCGYYDINGRGYAWFNAPGNVNTNIFGDFEFTNNTIYDSPMRYLITDGDKNLDWSADTKWNIRIENNTFINFSTRSSGNYFIDMRYIPGGSYMSVQRNLFVLAADDNDNRNLYFSGADIRSINGSGGFSYDVKDNYSVGCRDSHLVNDGIFTDGAFSATTYSFGALSVGNNGTADDLVVKVGSTPLKATDLFTNPNPPYSSHLPSLQNPLDHVAPDNIFEALRYKQTPEVLNHEIYNLSIGDPRWRN